MQLTAYHQIDVFDQLQPEWNDLLQRSASNRIFSTWEWQSTWWQSYQPGELWVITCRDHSGQIVGIAPWFIEHNPDRGRVIRSIGCVEVTDYLDIIVTADHAQAVMNCLAAHLAAHKDRFDILDLCNLPEHSLSHTLFPAVLQQHGFTVETQQQEVCPIIELPADWESYLSSLDKKNRHELRRKLRRAEGTSEKVAWYIVGQSHNLNDEIERFLTLMAASHPEKARFLQDQQHVTFFKTVTPIIYQKGWLQLSFLTIDDQAAAAYINFDYNNHILVYNSGLLPDEYGHLSPGIVLIAHNIQHAIETGHTIFDFLRGNEIYKYRLGAKDTRIFMLKACLEC